MMVALPTAPVHPAGLLLESHARSTSPTLISLSSDGVLVASSLHRTPDKGAAAERKSQSPSCGISPNLKVCRSKRGRAEDQNSLYDLNKNEERAKMQEKGVWTG